MRRLIRRSMYDQIKSGSVQGAQTLGENRKPKRSRSILISQRSALAPY